MILLYSLIILIFPVVIGLNIFIGRAIIKTALRKYIEPKLKENGLLFVDYKWAGLFSSGDFKDNQLQLSFMGKNGNISNSIYAYIYYKDLNNTKKITVRIDTTFLFIQEVAYSAEL